METTIHVQTVRVLANVQIMFKLIIAGGRDFNNYDGMSKCLDRLLKNINDNIEIVCGMARGADRLGERYAKEHGYKVIYMPADCFLGWSIVWYKTYDRNSAKYGT